MFRTRVHVAVTVLGLGLISVMATAVAADTPPPGPAQPGAWQPHYYELHYMGFTSTYTCSGLSDTVQQFIKNLGASPDSKVAPLPCPRGFDRPDVFATATLNFSTLKPADASADSDAATPASPKIAKARAQQAKTDQTKATTMSGEANGVWRHVVLGPRHPYPFGEGDCELMQQVRDQLLPLFAIRNLKSQIYCTPHDIASSHWSMSFDVFAPPKQG